MAQPKQQTVFAPWEDPQAKPLIQFQNVTKRFGGFTAIDNLSLDIFEQEFFALLGPSGCGKTTIATNLAAAFAQGELTADELRVLIGQPEGAMSTAGFFVGHAGKNDVALRRPALPCQTAEDGNRHGDHVLHVDRAPAP